MCRSTKVIQVDTHSLHYVKDLRQLCGLKPVLAQLPESAIGRTHAFEQARMTSEQWLPVLQTCSER